MNDYYYRYVGLRRTRRALIDLGVARCGSVFGVAWCGLVWLASREGGCTVATTLSTHKHIVGLTLDLRATLSLELLDCDNSSRWWVGHRDWSQVYQNSTRDLARLLSLVGAVCAMRQDALIKVPLPLPCGSFLVKGGGKIQSGYVLLLANGEKLHATRIAYS